MNLSKFVLFTSITVFFFSNCSNNENLLRFNNGTSIKSETYKLNIKDTANLFTEKNDTLFLNTFSDSLKMKTDTILYFNTAKGESKTVFGKIHQQVTNTRNPNSTEVYRFIKGGVYLLGYITSLNDTTYTRFNQPLIILPPKGIRSDSTHTIMKTFSVNAKPDEVSGLKVKSKVVLKKVGKVNFNGFTEDYYLFELTITQDVSMSYGERGLIIPDAILLKSNLLYGSTSGLFAEWGLRSRKKTTHTPSETPEQEAYLELIKYYKIQ